MSEVKAAHARLIVTDFDGLDRALAEVMDRQLRAPGRNQSHLLLSPDGRFFCHRSSLGLASLPLATFRSKKLPLCLRGTPLLDTFRDEFDEACARVGLTYRYTGLAKV